MIPNEHLKFFIKEDLFLVQSQEPLQRTEENVVHHELIVVVEESLNEELKELLTKILASVKVNLDDAKLLDRIPPSEFSFSKLILFGSKYPDLSKGTVLEAPKLSILKNSKDEKLKLWSALKELFGVS